MKRLFLILAFMCLCTAGCEKSDWPVIDRPQVVAFSAPWCKPCQRDLPTLRNLEALGVDVVKVNVDESPGFADKHHVVSVPLYLVYDRDGQRVERTGNVHAAARAAMRLLPSK